MIRLVKRASVAENAQTENERSNSHYTMAKTKLQCTQSDEVTRCRVRVQENGPLSMFNPNPVRELWLRYGHKYGPKAKETEKSLVVERRRRDDHENYKSKIFL